MTALTADRNTPFRDGEIVEYPVAASTTIYAGSMVALDSGKNVVPASDSAGLIVVGRADGRADNSGGAAGDVTVRVRRGVFGWEKAAADDPAATDMGENVYVKDDQTVTAATGSSMILAGPMVDLDTNYAWVRMGI